MLLHTAIAWWNRHRLLRLFGRLLPFGFLLTSALHPFGISHSHVLAASLLTLATRLPG